MNDKHVGIPIRFAPGFDPRPQWMRDLENAIGRAKADGWRLATHIVLEGDPYIVNDKPGTSRWGVCPDGCERGLDGIDECLRVE